MLLAGVSLPMSSKRDSSHCTDGSSMHSPLPTVDTRAAMISSRSNCNMMLCTWKWVVSVKWLTVIKFTVRKLKQDAWALGCMGAANIQVHVPRICKCSSIKRTCRWFLNRDGLTLQLFFLKVHNWKLITMGTKLDGLPWLQHNLRNHEIWMCKRVKFSATELPIIHICICNIQSRCMTIQRQ